MKKKKTLMVLMGWGTVLAAFAAPAPASPAILVNEHFDTDPRWTRTPSGFLGANNFGYNSALKAIAKAGSDGAAGTFERNTTTHRYYKDLGQTLDETQDFVFKCTCIPTTNLSGGIVYAGLFEAGKTNDWSGVSVYVYCTGTTITATMHVRYYTSTNGATNVSSAGSTLTAGSQYNFEIDYTAANRTFSFFAYLAGDPRPAASTVVLPAGRHIQPSQVGVGNYDITTTANDASAVVDDVFVSMGEGTLTGTVALAGFGGDYRCVGVAVDATPVGGGTTLRFYRLLDANGGFSLSIPDGAYNVGVQAAGCLRKVVPGIQINGGQTSLAIGLSGGDLDGDNGITSSDLAIILANLGWAGD